MNPAFFDKIEEILHTERMDAYRQDGANEKLTLARYALNMALSESLYPTLQFAEVGLRNAIHQAMTARLQTDTWYDIPGSSLTSWQQDQVTDAKNALVSLRKPLTAGRVVAELNFGFWTGFFNKAHGQTGIGHYLARSIYPHAPLNEQNLNRLGVRWRNIRDLRNRVFHHERILHWRDLDARHQAILEVIAWISPELHDLAKALDRFASLRSAGLKPWIAKLQRHWPHPSSAAHVPGTAAAIETVDEPFDATNGVHTPFGIRWGGDVFSLSVDHLEIIRQGQSLALDVMREYVVFLKAGPEPEPEEGGSSE
jgi:hypothetical protein